MIEKGSETAAYPAALADYAEGRDPVTRRWNPALPDEPGTIHALRPVGQELFIREPHFIEHTEDYRAAVCGALVKVIMPVSFKAAEEGACRECAQEMAAPAVHARADLYSHLLDRGDKWDPNRWAKKQRKRIHGTNE